MEKERVNERNGMETTQERRKGLILYINLFSNYLLIMILWKGMDQSNGKGTYHRKKWNGNNTRNVVKV